MTNIRSIMKIREIFQKPYIYFVVLIFLVYLLVNILISGFYDTIPLIIVYAKTVNWLELAISIILSLFIGILVAMNAVFVYVKYKERKKCAGSATLGGIGIIGGLATGVCPLCITGIFPLLLGVLGVSFSFASLPLKGIEIQVLVVFVLVISLLFLNRK